MTSFSKGRDAEKRYEQRLIDEGYTILFRSQRIMFGSVDFGYRGSKDRDLSDPAQQAKFDLVAWRHCRLYMVSVKSTGGGGKFNEETAKIQAFLDKYGNQWMCGMLAVWRGGRWVGRGAAKHFEHPHWEETLLDPHLSDEDGVIS